MNDSIVDNNIPNQKEYVNLKEKVNQKYKQRKQTGIKIANILGNNERYKKRAKRIRECSSMIIYSKCKECNHIQTKWHYLCRDRLCPVCNYKRSIQQFTNMCKICADEEFAAKKYKVAMLTLTHKTVEYQKIKEELQLMSQAYQRLEKRSKFKRVVQGYSKNVEIKLNTTKKTAHVHYHILLILKNDYSKYNKKDYITANELREIWKESLREDNYANIDIRYAYYKNENKVKQYNNIERAIIECNKYATKAVELTGLNENELIEYAQQVKNARYSSLSGVLKDIAKKLKIKSTEQIESIEEQISHCKKCNSTELIDLIAKYSLEEKVYNVFAKNI